MKRLSSGFTLIEVLVAMAITAFVALLSYNGLSAAINAAEAHQQQADDLANIQLPITVLERDIRHAVGRPIKDEYGDDIAALSGGELEDYQLILTRSGWQNPRGLPRGELQRVRYQLEGETLWRESWSVLDRVSEEESQRRTKLLEQVEVFSLRFLQRDTSSDSALGGEWQDSWDDPTALPIAIEINLELTDFGRVTRVFSLPQP